MKNRIKIIGRDYCLISESEIIDCDIIKGNEGSEIKTDIVKEKIIIYLLNQIKNNCDKLVINSTFNNKYDLFSIYNNQYYYGGVVGVIAKSFSMNKNYMLDNIEEYSTEIFDFEIILQIQSRFDVNKDGTSGKPLFLSKMLLGDTPKLTNNMVPSSNDDLFNCLLLFAFKYKLTEAYKKGYYRTYQIFEKNDDKIKGTIDIAKHIRLNMGVNNGKIAYKYKEKSIDNYLNHLIITAYENLKNKYFDMVLKLIDLDVNLRSIISNLKYSINYPKYDNRTLIMKNINPLSHPYYTEYESLRKICLLIINNQGLSVFDGDNEEVEGVLFYIPDLWENYIEKYIKSPEYYLDSQVKDFKIISYENVNGYIQSIRPDFIFYNDSNKKTPFMVLDAKFKKKWSDVIFDMKKWSEVMEDYDKCIRDMNSINSHATGVIFPYNNDVEIDSSKLIKHNISDYNKQDIFYTFPIYIPYSIDNVDAWSKNFEESCEKSFKIIKNFVIQEKTRFDNKNGDS